MAVVRFTSKAKGLTTAAGTLTDIQHTLTGLAKVVTKALHVFTVKVILGPSTAFAFATLLGRMSAGLFVTAASIRTSATTAVIAVRRHPSSTNASGVTGAPGSLTARRHPPASLALAVTCTAACLESFDHGALRISTRGWMVGLCENGLTVIRNDRVVLRTLNFDDARDLAHTLIDLLG